MTSRDSLIIPGSTLIRTSGACAEVVIMELIHNIALKILGTILEFHLLVLNVGNEGMRE